MTSFFIDMSPETVAPTVDHSEPGRASSEQLTAKYGGKHLTTTQAATVLGCAPRTVAKIFDAPDSPLRGFRVTDRSDRQIDAVSLAAYVIDRGIPLAGLDAVLGIAGPTDNPHTPDYPLGKYSGRFLSPNGAAKALRTCNQTVKKLCREGRLQFHKLTGEGGNHRIEADSVAKLMVDANVDLKFLEAVLAGKPDLVNIREDDEWTVLTTGQAAKIAKVSPRTVTKWMENGWLPGSYKLPGTGQDRRIPVQSLVRLLTDRGIPLGPLEKALPSPRVALMGDPVHHEALRPHFAEPRPGEAGLVYAQNSVELGAQLQRFRKCMGLVISAVTATRTDRMPAGILHDARETNLLPKDARSVLLLDDDSIHPDQGKFDLTVTLVDGQPQRVAHDIHKLLGWKFEPKPTEEILVPGGKA